MIMTHRVAREPEGAFTPQELVVFNRRHDAKINPWTREDRKLPWYFVPTPEGFDRNLDSDTLNALVWPTIIAHEEARLAALKPQDPLDIAFNV